jgi:hypothetical protein
LDAATSDAAREKISYRTGVRYRSPLDPLYACYGFDPVADSPTDCMHFLMNLG